MSLMTRRKAKVDEKQTGTMPKKRRTPKIVWIVVVTAVILAVLAAVFAPRGGQKPQNSRTTEYLYAQVERGDITSELAQSGVLEPADSYTVISLVSGEILLCDFETGDTVQKDDLLYEIDASDLSTNIKRAENSVEKARKNYNELVASRDDLTVKAPISGVISNLTAVVGNTMNKNAAVATIENTGTLLLTEYYSDEYTGQISVGMPATVSVSQQMLTLSGRVREISHLKRTSATGISCFAVTVEVENPGVLSIGDSATCWLSCGTEKLYPSIMDDNGLDASETTTVYCEITGTVSRVFARNLETVQAGQTLVTLTSNTLEDEISSAADSLEDAELSLQSQYDSLEKYSMTAPIDGTIVDKYYKQGENAETGKTLCTIFDLSSLTMTLAVDELDIKSVKVGQTAIVTSDANPGVTYDAVITEVGINGTASNGVTTYPVTVRIDAPDGLLPGMNVDISIVTSQRLNVLTVPAAAVQTGSRVLVKTADGTTGKNAPEGYDYVRVEIGASDEDRVEILSGLEEGSQIAYANDMAAVSDQFAQMMPGMPSMGAMGGMGGMSGMPSGGMPSGGMPSGAPGGSRPQGGGR